MSIIHCVKCASKVDTDYNTDHTESEQGFCANTLLIAEGYKKGYRDGYCDGSNEDEYVTPEEFDTIGMFDVIEEAVNTNLKCTRCGHEWRPRGYKLPKTCANKKCKSLYWNKERRKK